MTTQTTVQSFRNLFQSTRINKNEKPMTAAQAIKEAGLDWEVETYPIFYRNKSGKFNQIENRWTKATVRNDNGTCLGVVGPRYFPIQNVEHFNFFDEIVKSKEAMYSGAGQFNDGRLVWLQARLPKNILIAREDVVEKEITLISSHDGTMPLMVSLMPTRLACMNQLPLVRKNKELVIRHTVNFKNKVSEARRILGLSLKYFDAFAEEANTMAKKKLNVTQATDYFEGLLAGDKEEPSERDIQVRDKMLNLFEKGQGNTNPAIRHSVWTAYNAVTEYVDHYAEVRSQEDDVMNRLKNSWMGVGARMKEDAYEEALVLVKK